MTFGICGQVSRTVSLHGDEIANYVGDIKSFMIKM